MLTSRNNLVKSFQQAESVPLSEVKSLNEWQLKKSKDDTPLAGALAYKGSLPYLVGHNHELLLENFTEHTPVFLGASGDPSFTAKDLRDGDKIVVSFKNKKINKVRVLSRIGSGYSL